MQLLTRNRLPSTGIWNRMIWSICTKRIVYRCEPNQGLMSAIGAKVGSPSYKNRISILDFCSLSTETPRRRRRDAGSMDGDSLTTGDARGKYQPQQAVQDTHRFKIAANQFLQRVQSAVEPMKQYNSVFDVLLEATESGHCLKIVLHPQQGVYTLTSDEDTCTISMISPLSGAFTYVLCSQTGNFVGMEDGHILEGMLVRDLIKQCHGLPKF